MGRGLKHESSSLKRESSSLKRESSNLKHESLSFELQLPTASLESINDVVRSPLAPLKKGGKHLKVPLFKRSQCALGGSRASALEGVSPQPHYRGGP